MDENKGCFICGQDEGISDNFQGGLELENKREIHIKGILMDKHGTPVSVCKGCLASLLFTTADLFHEEALKKERKTLFQH
jgi:hypothetical protein